MLPKENEISGFSWKKSANLATRGLCTTSKKTCWGGGWCCSGNFNWGVGFIAPQDPHPTPLPSKKSLSPDSLHSLWCLSEAFRHLKTSVLPTLP